MSAMTWEQKLAACKSLAECCLAIRKPGDWYVHWQAHLTEHGSVLMSGQYGNGSSPQEAVEDHWRKVTGIKPNEYWLAYAHTESMRRAARWNGYMWEPVFEASP
jgi:hypothetical protein